MPALTLGVVSTYPPREDGIATYTRDVLHAVRAGPDRITAEVAAITDSEAFYAYPRQVRWEIEQGNPTSFADAGRALTRARVDVVSIQHEFGLFGIWGEPLIDYTAALLETVKTPVVTTLHTVLPQPRADIREAIRQLCERSAAVVVMVNLGTKDPGGGLRDRAGEARHDSAWGARRPPVRNPAHETGPAPGRLHCDLHVWAA